MSFFFSVNLIPTAPCPPPPPPKFKPGKGAEGWVKPLCLVPSCALLFDGSHCSLTTCDLNCVVFFHPFTDYWETETWPDQQQPVGVEEIGAKCFWEAGKLVVLPSFPFPMGWHTFAHSLHGTGTITGYIIYITIIKSDTILSCFLTGIG